MKISSIFSDITPCSTLKSQTDVSGGTYSLCLFSRRVCRKKASRNEIKLCSMKLIRAWRCMLLWRVRHFHKIVRKCVPEDVSNHYCEKLRYGRLYSSFNVTRPSFKPIQNNRCKCIFYVNNNLIFIISGSR
jgi:hypothetical protein